MKKIVNVLLSKIGFKIINKDFLLSRPMGIIDLREIDKNLTPLDIKNIKSKNHIYFLMNIQADKIKKNRLIESWVNTLKLYEIDKEQEVAQRKSFNYLKNYYTCFQPKNVREYFEFDTQINDSNSDSNEYFHKHPYCAVFPWENVSPDQMFKGNKSAIKSEFERNSEFKYEDSDGCKMFGPISDRMLKVEYERLIKVYNSIKLNGYLDENNSEDEMDNFPRATIFVDKNGNYQIKSEGAWHRTATLLALDYKFLPFRVSNKNIDIFRESEVENWSNVINGLFNKEQALLLFNKNI